MLLVLIVDHAHMAYRGRLNRADLLRPTCLPFDLEVDNQVTAGGDLQVKASARLRSPAGSSQPRSWLRSTAFGGGPIFTGAL
jgi:hypothetical protein